MTTVHQEALQLPMSAQPTHWLQCQYGSGFAIRQMKLCSFLWRGWFLTTGHHCIRALQTLVCLHNSLLTNKTKQRGSAIGCTFVAAPYMHICSMLVFHHYQAVAFVLQVFFFICYCAHELIVCICHIVVSVNYIKFILLKWTLVVSPLPFLSHKY